MRCERIDAGKIICVVAFFLAHCSFPVLHAQEENRIDLREHWFLQSSCKVQAPPEVLSTSRFAPEDRIEASVPSTVLAAQVAAGEYKDIFYADNLRKLPGMNGQGENPYACSWWFRTEFQLPPRFQDKHIWLRFNGINSKANIWLNGKMLADATVAAGAYRILELDVTPFLNSEGINVLATEVFAPTGKDFGVNFVDWMPTPPDKDLGLWREVSLLASGPVRLRYPAIATHFPAHSLECADLTVRAELSNDTGTAVEGTLRGEFEGITFEKHVRLAARESRSEIFAPSDFPQLKIVHPKLWWPAELGKQTLHRLRMSFAVAGAVSDAAEATFGIREITGEIYGNAPRMGEVYDNNGDFVRLKTDSRPFLLRVNHQPIMIRAAGWAPEILLRSSEDRLRKEMAYVRDMHLNAIRLEGKLEGDTFFDIADQMGILILAGWCCCDQWEHWKDWQPNDYTIAAASMRTQSLRLRHHASAALWMNGSDNTPPANVERIYRNVLAETGWPNAIVSSASAKPSTVSGPSGVKMTGPYDYVPPGYWLIDKEHFGGAFGFNTETSPGAAIPEIGSLKKFLPTDHLWPIDSLWLMHTGAGGLNGNLNHFNEAMDAIYGPAGNLKEYLAKAQAMNYDGERAMYEAYDGNKYHSTGVVQWMLNNGWPSMMWHLYDYYLEPAGGYFGAKKAGEPVHIQYSYDDRSISVVNNVIRSFPGLTAEISVYNFDLRRLYEVKQHLDSAADSVRRIWTVPTEKIGPGVHFVRLTLTSARGELLSANFYWLPEQTSTFDWSTESEKRHPYYTGVTHWEDMKELNRLQPVRIEATTSQRTARGGEEVRVRIHNPSNRLAFQVHLTLVNEDNGEEILPVLWEDNYISLLPGESRTVTARFHAPRTRLGLEVNGWNIETMDAAVTEGNRIAKQ